MTQQRLCDCVCFGWTSDALFQMQVESEHVVSVRLILRQPSSAWLTFSLEEIKIFPHVELVSLVFCSV